MWLCAVLVPRFLLCSCCSGLCDAAGFLTCAIDLKIMVRLFCFRESHVPNKGIGHIGSSGRMRVKVTKKIELKTVV